LFEEETGTKWTVEHKSLEGATQIADEKLANGDYSSFSDYLKIHIFRDGEGKSAKETELANKELGLPAEDLRATIQAALKA
jgi:Zn-dependent M32 family carboxypeptidase